MLDSHHDDLNIFNEYSTFQVVLFCFLTPLYARLIVALRGMWRIGSIMPGLMLLTDFFLDKRRMRFVWLCIKATYL